MGALPDSDFGEEVPTKFETYRSTADLSVFSLERSVNITSLGGRVAMLTPNKWFRASYGKLFEISSETARTSTW